MKNPTNYLAIEKPESNFNQTENNKIAKKQIFSILTVFSKQLSQSLLGCDEPKIWVTFDKSGKKNWHAYDPVTGRYVSVDSETEMRVWIEKRYYQ